MSELKKIPLFPLNVVLFPASKLPLHIFEDRYKIMINKCVKEEKSFGINLFLNDKIFLTGCTAYVDEVTKTSDSGELDIVTKGLFRYTIADYELSSDGYFTGNVEFNSENNLISDTARLYEAVNLYNELIGIVYKGSIKTIDPDDEKWSEGNLSVSFLMAEKCGLNLNERQKLLEINNEDDRIYFILNYFEEVMPKLKDADRISSIIMSDGYIVQ
ncbi:MAG: LON peptidase substrate-binding domain-containing protein [Ignavibacteria bacterium]|nr:LON peptidase substrate-binding domain-containing protein [Ignavibacteria bacterium]